MFMPVMAAADRIRGTRMGIFGRKQTPVSTTDPTLDLRDSDLAAASRVLDQWDRSLGNSDATWDTLEAVARLGGWVGETELITEVSRGMDATYVANRPWRWWAEVAKTASDRGDFVLAGRVFLFMRLFLDQILPNMRAVDQMTTGLGRPDQSTTFAIAFAGANALGQLPPQMIIHDTATGTVDVAAALGLANNLLSNDTPA